MIHFKTLVNIDSDLLDFVGAIERRFSITLDKGIIDGIYKDSAEDQAGSKQYLILGGAENILGVQMTISGIVEAHEPETIWIELRNIAEKDARHFVEMGY